MPGFPPPRPGDAFRSTQKGLPQSPDSPNFRPGRNPGKTIINPKLGPGPTRITVQGKAAPRPSDGLGSRTHPNTKPSANRQHVKADSTGKPTSSPKGFGHPTPPSSGSGSVPKAPKRSLTNTNPGNGVGGGGVPTPPGMSAEEFVNAQLAPVLASLDATSKGYDTQAAQRADAIKSMTQALLQQLSGTPAQIGGFYDQAINTNTALADRSAQLLQQANPNPQVQNDLAAIGAPQAQQDQVAHDLSNTFNGGAAALFGTQGKLPGAQLLGDKAAAQTGAVGHLAALGGFGEQALMDALRQDNIYRSGLASQRAGVEGKRPGLLAQAQNDIADREIKAKALASNQQYIDFVTGQKTKASKQAQQRINLTKRSLNIREEQTLSNLYGRDSKGNLTLAGQKAQDAAGRANARYGKLTGAQRQRLQATAADTADEAFHGWADKDGTKHDPVPYQQAILDMVNHGIPLKIAQQTLNRFWSQPGQTMPWEKPGQGRPRVPIQQRKGK